MSKAEAGCSSGRRTGGDEDDDDESDDELIGEEVKLLASASGEESSILAKPLHHGPPLGALLTFHKFLLSFPSSNIRNDWCFLTLTKYSQAPRNTVVALYP